MTQHWRDPKVADRIFDAMEGGKRESVYSEPEVKKKKKGERFKDDAAEFQRKRIDRLTK